MQFTVEAVCISNKKGVQKHTVDEVVLVENYGIKDDAHAGKWHRQVSLLAVEDINSTREKGLDLASGAFGENIVTRGIDWSKTAVVGGKISIEDAELEITQIGKVCNTPCSIYYAAGECIMTERGIFTRVLKGGIIRAHSFGHYHL
jgi:MOSC domain-containing protein YiiM